MKKLVNVYTKSPIRLKSIPIRSDAKHIYLDPEDIKTCIMQKGRVEEILDDGKILPLNFTNYNTDNNAAIRQAVREQEAAAKARIEQEEARAKQNKAKAEAEKKAKEKAEAERKAAEEKAAAEAEKKAEEEELEAAIAAEEAAKAEAENQERRNTRRE